MAERFIVLDTDSLKIPVYESEDDAVKFAADSAVTKVVIPVTVPDDSHSVLYTDIHEWALETDDPSAKGKKYAMRYDNAGQSFDEHRSIPREVVDAYFNVKGQDAEKAPTARKAVKVNRDG